MLVKTLLKRCETGFSFVAIADSTSGHTREYISVKEAQIEAGDNKVIAWETGVYLEGSQIKLVLFITV